MLSLSLGHRLEHRHEQKLEVEHHLVQMRIELAQAIHGYRYQQRADCPDCGHRLTTREILEGFLPNPTDTTTKCPNCERRFQPVLVASAGHGSQIEVSFLCPDQALYALAGMENCSPEQIQHDDPGAYQSALVHFGSLRAAFARRNTTYTLEDLHGWKTKVIPFLGQLPDTIIAEIVGVSNTTIGNMRKRAGIARYRASDHV